MMTGDRRRYVALEHTMADGTHCDLMFELDGRLITWRLTDLDELMAGGPIDAVRTADHRIGYLDYEGSVPGDRGAVRVLARGFLQAPGWSEDGMRAELIGDLAGVLTVRRTGGPAWRLVLSRPDKHERDQRQTGPAS